MLRDNPTLPIAVLAVLPEEGFERSAWPVPTLDTRRLPDCPASPRQPQVEFIVLVAHQFLVEQSDPVKDLTRPAAEIDRINRSFIARIMSARTPGRERGLERRRNRSAHGPCPSGNPGATDVVCPGLLA